jgi:hypothetical protein
LKAIEQTQGSQLYRVELFLLFSLMPDSGFVVPINSTEEKSPPEKFQFSIPLRISGSDCSAQLPEAEF